MEMGQEVLPIVESTPVLAGVCGTDPFRMMPRFLRQLERRVRRGAELSDGGAYRWDVSANLEETGMGYGLEVDMIRSRPRALV